MYIDFDSLTTVILPIIASVIVSYLTTIATNFARLPAIRYEQKLAFRMEQVRTRTEAIQAVRSRIAILTEYEDLTCIYPVLLQGENGVEPFRHTVAHALMSKEETFERFKEINEAVGDADIYVSRRARAAVLRLDNFMLSHARSAIDNNMEDIAYAMAGKMITEDFISYARRVDSMLVNELNKLRTRCVKIGGKRWKIIWELEERKIDPLQQASRKAIAEVLQMEKKASKQTYS